MRPGSMHDQNRSLAAVATVVAAAVLLTSTAANTQTSRSSPAPLSIARQGYLFAGGTYSTEGGQRVLSGHLYAEYQIPSRQTHPWPVVMVPGGFQLGTNFTGTPDDREGWAQHFLRRGYAVYVVDQPGRGRAAYEARKYGPAAPVNFNTVQGVFVAPERTNLWPQARLHTQWPGTGAPGDAVFDQFLSSQVPAIQDFTVQQRLNRDALIALLEKIGPSILLTHSQSGTFGWPVADARPDLVKAIVAIEPNGPPFFDVTNLGAPDWFRDAPTNARSWGPTAMPLTYEPAAATPADLKLERQATADGPDLVRCTLQAVPARQLPKLAALPVLVVTGEASYHAPYDHCTVKFLEQAGLHPTFVKLADAGIRGNGHMMMIEKNNQEIAALIERWLAKSVPGRR